MGQSAATGASSTSPFIGRELIFLAVCSLPFCSLFFSLNSGIAYKGSLLLAIGLFSWGLILLSPQKFLTLPRQILWPLSLYVLACLLAWLFSPQKQLAALGLPYFRLGAAGLLSTVGASIVVADLPKKKLIEYSYAAIATTSLVGLIFQVIKYHVWVRLGGLFYQPDAWAIYLAVGYLLGLEISRRPRYMRPVWTVQSFLLASILLTETRAVILPLVLGLAFIILRYRNHLALRMFVGSILLAIILFAAVVKIYPVSTNRLVDAGYAADSISYRLDLQSAGLKAATKMPFWGTGPARINQYILCPDLASQRLQQTCAEGFSFESSHNIFLDRLLELGWLGGLAFLALLFAALFRAFKTKQTTLLGCIMLISIYYLTNVTIIEVELLLWIVLLMVARNPKMS